MCDCLHDMGDPEGVRGGVDADRGKRLTELLNPAGFGHVRRATEGPLNMPPEARP